MPKDTRVYRCVKKLKKKKNSKVNPYAVCQAATNQKYSDGKPLHEISKHLARKALAQAGDYDYEDYKISDRKSSVYDDLLDRIGNKWGPKEREKADLHADFANYPRDSAKAFYKHRQERRKMAGEKKFYKIDEAMKDYIDMEPHRYRKPKNMTKAEKWARITGKEDARDRAIRKALEDDDAKGGMKTAKGWEDYWEKKGDKKSAEFSRNARKAKSVKESRRGRDERDDYANKLTGSDKEKIEAVKKRLKMWGPIKKPGDKEMKKEENIVEWPGPTANELKPLKKLVSRKNKTPPRLRARELAKQLATPKDRLSDKPGPLFPRKGEALAYARAGLANDKAKIMGDIKAGMPEFKKRVKSLLKLREEHLAEEFNRHKMTRYLALGKTGKIGKNLEVVHDPETNTHVAKLHGHPIIRKYADNSFEVHGQGSVTGGKPSVTTKRHINAYMNANGYRSFGHSKHVFTGPDGKEAKTNEWIGKFKPKTYPLHEEDEMNEDAPIYNVHDKNGRVIGTHQYGSGFKSSRPGEYSHGDTIPSGSKISRDKVKVGGRSMRMREEDEMDTTGNLVNALVDKNALDVKDAFNDAMQAILPDMVEVEKERIASTIIPQEDDGESISDEEMDAFFDSLSDEEFEQVMNAITDEEIPDEDYEVDAEESSDDED